MRVWLTLVALVLLVVGCAQQETALRQQMIGTWYHGDSAELVFLADGGFISKVKRIDGDGRDDGTWKLKDGVLVMKTTHSYFRYGPRATHMETVNGSINPEHHRVTLVDETHLAIVSDDELNQYYGAKTNVWERKK